MSKRKPVLPRLRNQLMWWTNRTQGTSAHAGVEKEIRAAEAVIRAARRDHNDDGAGCPRGGGPCRVCRALARLDKVTGRDKR